MATEQENSTEGVKSSIRLDRDQIEAIAAAVQRDNIEIVQITVASDDRLRIFKVESKEVMKPTSLTTRKQTAPQGGERVSVS